VVLEVTDHGPGLPPGDLSHVFDRFYRADASRGRHQGGAGLGLSIVAAIVQAHGGRVGVLNVAGAGARFRVELPALELPSDSQPVARFVPAEEPIVEAGPGRDPHERAVH
ncbi:MAG TPA: sensor histidine kinase, partial [Acidothermaceae bacterium]|nr:sensor histidine kinase [Acidothermaceae bacterium]